MSKITAKCYELAKRTELPKEILEIKECKGSDLEELVTKLIQLWGQEYADAITKHIGKLSTYTHKDVLRHELNIIQLILTDNFLEKKLGLSEKELVKSELTSDIRQCTAGHHGRVKKVIRDLFEPEKERKDELRKLLTEIRYDLVDVIARVETDDIHEYNDYTLIAQIMGLGIESIHPDDPYSAALLNYKRISRNLKIGFDNKFQPFSIMFMLEMRFRSKLEKFGYLNRKIERAIAPKVEVKSVALIDDKEHRKEKKELEEKKIESQFYNQPEYENFLTYMEQLVGGRKVILDFLKPSTNYYDMLLVDDQGLVIDIDWMKFRKLLWHRLNSQEYMKFSEPEKILLDSFINGSEILLKKELPLAFDHTFFVNLFDCIQFINLFTLRNSEKLQLLIECLNNKPIDRINQYILNEILESVHPIEDDFFFVLLKKLNEIHNPAKKGVLLSVMLKHAIQKCSLAVFKKILEANQSNLEIKHGFDQLTVLMCAIKNGCMVKVHELIVAGANVNAVDRENTTPLMLAVQQDNIEIVNLLLSARAHINAKNEGSWTPLWFARTQRPKNEKLIQLLEINGALLITNIQTLFRTCLEKANVQLIRRLLEEKEIKGEKALRLAAENNEVKTLKALIAAGVNVDARDEDWTPLMIAAGYGQIQAVESLLEEKADIHAKRGGYWTALANAAKHKHSAIVGLLLKKGADGGQALYAAAREGQIPAMRTLIAAGINVETCDDDWTPLMIAAGYGQVQAVGYLLEAKADIHAKQGGYWTALANAAKHEHSAIVSLLLKKGADGAQAFYAAAREGQIQAMKTLMAAGINVDICDKGRTPLWIAAGYGNIRAVKYLLEAKANIHAIADDEIKIRIGDTALHQIARYGHPEIADILLQAGAIIDAQNKEGMAPLTLAVEFKQVEMVKVLIKNNADINIKTRFEWTPLMIAAQNNDVEIARLLLDAKADGAETLKLAIKNQRISVVDFLIRQGIDVNMIDAVDGQTALMYAVSLDDWVIIQMLLKAGINVNACSTEGWTALMFAAKAGHPEIITALLSAGATVDPQNHLGRTALQIAMEYHHLEIASLLVPSGVDAKAMLWKAIEKGEIDLVKILIKKMSSDVQLNGDMLLMLAAKKGHAEIVVALLEVGADGHKALNRLTEPHAIRCLMDAGVDGEAALCRAAQKGQIYAIYLLLLAGVNVNARGREGSTALIEAVRYRRIEAVRLLLNASVDVNIKNKAGDTAITLARSQGYSEILSIFEPVLCESDPCMFSIQNSNPKRKESCFVMM